MDTTFSSEAKKAGLQEPPAVPDAMTSEELRLFRTSFDADKIKMLIKTEYYTDEHGNEMKKEYYGKDEEHITGTICSPAKNVSVPEQQLLSESEELALDTNAKVSYLECLAELNNG